MSKLLNVPSFPHVRSHETTHSIMLNVAIATSPAIVSGVYHFDMHVLLVFMVTAVACALSEYVYGRLMRGQSTVSDCSALAASMALALNTPPEIPVWIPALSGISAIIVVKWLYGGLGQSFMNPALAARCFLLTPFVGKTTNLSYSRFDSMSGVTSLAMLKSGQTVDAPTMLVGSIPGTIGGVSVTASSIGAIYLLAKKVISIRIPGTYILTVVVFAILFGSHGLDLNYIVAYLYGDDLVFGAFFMAADYVTSPIMPKGQTAFGILLGVFTGLFRIFDGSTEGVSCAIIIDSILTPLIEEVTLPKASGKEDR